MDYFSRYKGCLRHSWLIHIENMAKPFLFLFEKHKPIYTVCMVKTTYSYVSPYNV